MSTVEKSVGVVAEYTSSSRCQYSGDTPSVIRSGLRLLFASWLSQLFAETCFTSKSANQKHIAFLQLKLTLRISRPPSANELRPSALACYFKKLERDVSQPGQALSINLIHSLILIPSFLALLERKIQSFFRKTYCRKQSFPDCRLLTSCCHGLHLTVLDELQRDVSQPDQALATVRNTADRSLGLADIHATGELQTLNVLTERYAEVLDISATDLRSRYFHPRYDADLQTLQAFNNDEKSWKDFIAKTKKDDWKTNALNAAECLHNTGAALELVGRKEEAERWWNMSDELQRYYGV
ncbi:hypothetical protein LTR15_001754 [Elasticomyces elasticus]|nr:hypothetical protein LTR15_001754 [Elasticomyces elasticus]